MTKTTTTANTTKLKQQVCASSRVTHDANTRRLRFDFLVCQSLPEFVHLGRAVHRALDQREAGAPEPPAQLGVATLHAHAHYHILAAPVCVGRASDTLAHLVAALTPAVDTTRVVLVAAELCACVAAARVEHDTTNKLGMRVW